MSLDSQFPDMTMNYAPKPPRPMNESYNQSKLTYNVDTLDIAGINKKADQRLQRLNDGACNQYINTQ